MADIEYQRNGRIETITREEAHRNGETLVAYDNPDDTAGVENKIRLPIERVVAVHD